MTDINVDELIAEGRRAVEALGVRQSTMLVNRLADALEAVKSERDEALAVIERIAKIAESDDPPAWDAHQDLIRLITRTTPADALRAVKAEAWDEGAEMGHRLYAEPLHIAQRRNPYREETTRG